MSLSPFGKIKFFQLLKEDCKNQLGGISCGQCFSCNQHFHFITAEEGRVILGESFGDAIGKEAAS